MDIEEFGFKIRKIAHLLDKDISIGRYRYNRLREELYELLKLWDKKFNKKDPTIIWAKRIFTVHKKRFTD